MIKCKWVNHNNNAILQLTFLWIFAISMHWYVAKGDHAEISLSIGPLDLRFGTSVWWSRLTP